MHPQPNTQQLREEQQRKEEARRDEQERRTLETQLRTFDAHGFYQAIEVWANHPIPSPVRQIIQLTPLRQKVMMHQPLPLTRSDLNHVRKLSSDCVRLLTLLRAIDQRGMECPCVHRMYRANLEKAVDKCARLKEARENHKKRRGLLAWCSYLLNGLHLDAMAKDLDFFQSRLEAILMICRHEEFAQDLVHLRRAVTYRTGLLLKPGDGQGAGRGRQTNGPRPVPGGKPRAMPPPTR